MTAKLALKVQSKIRANFWITRPVNYVRDQWIVARRRSNIEMPQCRTANTDICYLERQHAMNRTELSSVILARMASGAPFTYGDLHYPLPKKGTDGCETARVADQAIQRWRKKGWISFTRVRGQCVWSLTNLGTTEARNITSRVQEAG